MKPLWVVKDIPQYSCTNPNHYVVVRAQDEAEAIRIVNERLNKNHMDWDVERIDNTEVWE